MSVVVSHYEVRPLLEAYRRGLREVETTPDLGRTRVVVHLDAAGIHYPEGIVLPWAGVEDMLAHPNVCFRVDRSGWHRLQRYSPVSGRVVALFPTGTAPTVTLSGIPMHRIQGTDPWRDTEAKIRAARPRGRVLDTCTGLGYTALAAARRATFVLSVEIDPAVLALARENPWSRDLFALAHVHLVLADVVDIVAGLPAAFFDVIVHDPPMFRLAGELYSAAFYRDLYRILRPGGRLFHYVGSPEKKMARNVTRGVAQRLREAGFHVRPAREAFGLVALRPRRS